ncbi:MULTISPECIES: peptidoglycan-binding protein LysM [Dokdonia]|jgi:nucleoid-associated protein YgaU|uniref:Potassium binding protein Kbp n=3 Tax=Dokdonia TaxID=326319 RepID=A0A0A2H2W2_9FLAO|nr:MULTISPECIES: peptidoglycan-binding protein LysM [Dokdonia]AOE05863.1 peptidoglycan-binding protein LysM, carbohydrate-binding module family CBM50 [uncultured bacterium]MDE0598333.1 peptidoglycan-binding protein LysM [Dokdonia donghaensis]ANH59625.1 LysM domain/BON superfamily protein [Dokdonia donghaensis DSW-1]EAQ39744.1 hypothetical protein MED134_09636 [Dokdonia sp. MED134]KGO06985.1 peptidase M23B [Dokdonia donghaensis DSW-1]
MGLFSFIKNAGAKVFGIGKTEEEEAAEAAAVAEEKIAMENAKAASNMAETISDLGLDVDDLDISIDGDVAVVAGSAHDQATKEKVILVVGNSTGIATVDDRLTVENPEPEARFYTVEKGDSLSKISKAMYGDPMKYPQIFEANKPMLKDVDLIYPGQVLRIPHLEK